MPKSFNELDTITIDQFIYSQFIKYNQLHPVITPFLPKKEDKRLVHVFIDVYELTSVLYHYYRYTNPLSLTSCLINAAIHYRNFFRKYGAYSNIFLIYSSNMSVNNSRFCPEYNYSNLQQMMSNHQVRNIIHKNLDLTSIVVPYLPDIYFRISTVEPYVVIGDMIMKFYQHNLNPPTFVITPLPLAFQLPLFCPNTVLLARKKKEGTLYVGTPQNAIHEYVCMTKKKEMEITIDNRWISGLFTLVGDTKRDVKSLCSITKAFQILENMKNSAETLNPDSIFTFYCDMYKKGFIGDLKGKSIEEVYHQIHNRFKCFDLNTQIILYNTLPECKENTFLKQLQNTEELFRMNSLYFKDNPIQLDLL